MAIVSFCNSTRKNKPAICATLNCVNTLNVYAVGSSVLLDGTVPTRVTEIFIREGRVSYEVVWWNDRERNEEVVDPWEIKPNGEESQKLRVNQIL